MDYTVWKEHAAAELAERAYPHIVELPQPPNGFGATLQAMEAWARERGIQLRYGRRQRRDDQEYVRWCFADAATAEKFRNRFGGK